MTVSLRNRRNPISPMAANFGRICLSEPATLDLCVHRGDSGRFRVTVTDPDGLPVDVSAGTWDCDIRRTPDDPVLTATMQVTPVAGTTNAVDVILSAAESTKLTPGIAFVWDLELTLGTEVMTLLRGGFQVTPDVSRPGM